VIFKRIAVAVVDPHEVADKLLKYARTESSPSDHEFCTSKMLHAVTGSEVRGVQELIPDHRHAGVAELVHAQVSKTCSPKECRFESDRPHQAKIPDQHAGRDMSRDRSACDMKCRI
jgi:hypothetical protein